MKHVAVKVDWKVATEVATDFAILHLLQYLDNYDTKLLNILKWLTHSGLTFWRRQYSFANNSGN